MLINSLRKFYVSVLLGFLCSSVSYASDSSQSVALNSQSSSQYAAAKKSFISIGTGGVTGVYYPAGGSICRMVNRGQAKHGIKCSVESTGGSIYNLKTIRNGQLDMGIAQSDWQYHAYNGSGRAFEKTGADRALRSVFSLHAEPFTVVARTGSGIKTFSDLKGKRVNIGNPGSGQRGTMEVVMEVMGWTKRDFRLASELKSAEQSQALCDNKVDAIVFSVGHPSGSIKEATTSCDAILINVVGPEIENLIQQNSYYRKAVIPGGMYRGTEEDITTFGVGATFVSSEQVPEYVIYEVVKAVFTNFSRFRKLHPSFGHLEEKNMIRDGLTAPLHAGALRYYRERGWM